MLRTIFLCLLAAASLGADSVYNVTIGTLGLSGDSGYLVFDFISGGGPNDNAVSIEGFTSDGTLGAVTSTTGQVFGVPSPPALPGTVILVDDPVTAPFNEYQNAFTFGTTMSFVVDATENAPGAGSSPDELSLYFLASDDATSLITTSDPTTADSLLTLDLDGSANGVPTVFSVSDPSGVSAGMTLYGGSPGGPPATVPEPSTWPVLAAVCLFGLSRLHRRSSETRGRA
jgi:hypothetical protein